METFYSVFPTPWLISGAEIVDRDGEMVMGIDLEADGSEAFWSGIVEAVNFHAREAPALDVVRKEGLTDGIAMSIAFMLRGGNETEAHEWWHACGLTVAELEQIGVDDYDLDPIRIAGLDPDHCFDPDDCPGHVAAAHDPRICGRCGIQIDELRPPDDIDPVNLAGSGPVPIEPREG